MEECRDSFALVIVKYGSPGFEELFKTPSIEGVISSIEGYSLAETGRFYKYYSSYGPHPSISLDLDLDGIVEVIGRSLRLESKYPEGLLWAGVPRDALLWRLFTISEPLQSTIVYTLVDASTPEVTTNVATIDTVNQRIVAGVTNGEVTPQKVTITATATDNSVDPPVEYSDTLDLYIGYKISKPFHEDFSDLAKTVDCPSKYEPIAIVTGGAAGYEKYVNDPLDTSLGSFVRVEKTGEYVAYCYDTSIKPTELHLYFNAFSGKIVITPDTTPLAWQYKTEEWFIWNGLSKQYDFSTLLNVASEFGGVVEDDVEYILENAHWYEILEENMATITPKGVLTAGYTGDLVTPQEVLVTATAGGHSASTTVHIGYTIYLGDEHPGAIEECDYWGWETESILKPLISIGRTAHPLPDYLFLKKEETYDNSNILYSYFYNRYDAIPYNDLRGTPWALVYCYNAAEPNPDFTQVVIDLDLDGELVIDVPPFTGDTTD